MSSPESANGDGGASADAAYRYERDSDERPSVAAVVAVATATGKPVIPDGPADEATPDAVSPLYEVVDPDALDALVLNNGNDEADCSVRFTYCEHQVTVTEHVVTVSPIA